jgi:hypothetical protein
VEVKAGQTLSSDMAGGIGKIAPLFAPAGQTVVPVVGYGGGERQTRNGVTYLPWHDIQNYAWAG